MNGIILMDGAFYLSDFDDDRVVALSDPIPRGLVPLFPHERLADWEALYHLPKHPISPRLEWGEFEVLHDSDMLCEP